MKLTYAQLETHLTKQLAPAYLISGEELFLKQDAAHLIRKAAKKAGFTERVRLSIETNLNEEGLYSLFNTVSLFAEKRIVELDFRETTPNKSFAKILEELAGNLSKDMLLILSMGKIDDKTAKSTWFQTLEKSGVSLPLWPLSREQLVYWIQQRARKYKLQCHADAVDVLADYVEGNLIAAAQTLEKLYLLQPEKIIDSHLIQSILTDESRFTLFDFTDNLIGGNQTKALHILTCLQEESIDPTLILWSITRELRLLTGMARQIEQGEACEKLLQKQRIFPRRQAALLTFLKKFNAADCFRFMSYAGEIDSLIKGGSKGNIWDQLQLFCLRLA